MENKQKNFFIMVVRGESCRELSLNYEQTVNMAEFKHCMMKIGNKKEKKLIYVEAEQPLRDL